MFDILAAAFLFGTVIMVAFVAFLGYQQWQIDRLPDVVPEPTKAIPATVAVLPIPSSPAPPL